MRDGERRPAGDALVTVPSGADDLRRGGRLHRARRRAAASDETGWVAAPVPGRGRAARSVNGWRPGEQRVVDAVLELVRGGEVRAGGADRAHERGDQREAERDAPTQAHGSRTTYPTPRTVWSRRGSTLGFGLAAQVADVDVERARAGLEVEAPDPVVDRVAPEHDAGVQHEQLEQVELGLGELERRVRRARRCGAAGRG